MSATKLFFNFLGESFDDVKANLSQYVSLFFALVVLANLEEAYQAFGGLAGDGGSIAIGLVSLVLAFVVTAKIILINKKNTNSNETLIYILIPFLLYSFYYSLFFFLGLLLFIIPGIFVLIFLSQAPLIATLAPTSENFFKRSIALVKKNIKLVAWVSCTSVFLEFMSLAFSPIQDPVVRWVLTAIFSIPDAALTIVLTVASVKIFYYLNEK